MLKNAGLTLMKILTLLSFPKAEIRSAHSLVFSKLRKAFSICVMYDLYFESFSNSHSSAKIVRALIFLLTAKKNFSVLTFKESFV